MNKNKLSRIFPRASQSFIKLNQDSSNELCTNNEKPVKGEPLVSVFQREAKGRHRFKIIFRVFATRPADWDNYDVKSLQDLAVKSGMLPSDDWATLQGEVIPFKVYQKEEERTEIEIFEL